MSTARRVSLALVVALAGLVGVVALFGCSLSTHPVTPSTMGRTASSDDMLRESDGPKITVTRVDSARWKVDRGGLIHLDHPRAVEAKLENELEPIVISFWVLEHPERGTYIVDTGVAESFRSEETAPVSSLVASAMNFEHLHVDTDLASWLRDQGPIEGVFLTHLHLDHIMGMPDLPADVPIFTGPGETAPTEFLFMFVQGTVDDLLGGKSPLREWRFADDPGGRFAGVLDVFGDGSLYALHVPGHTPGSTAFFVRSTSGPQLLVGDASHTSWGWNHCVEPGTFNHDREGSASSLRRLKAFAAEVADLSVEPGHQHHNADEKAEPCL